MILTGFTDEASSDIDIQIKVTNELGWSHLSARTIGEYNIHDISDADFNEVVQKLKDANIKVAEFGTLIGNWAKSIHSDWNLTFGEVESSIERMKVLNVKYARIMSYAQEPWGEDQLVTKRIKRLRRIVDMFRSEGLEAVHENCMNYGGFSADHTLELLNEVPDLKLVFDTGNPVFQKDRSKSEPYPWQNSWDFYDQVKEVVTHVHIKDAKYPEGGDDPKYTFPGDGDAYVKEILGNLKSNGYDGFIAIEPHMAKVFHEDNSDGNVNKQYEVYLEYGRKMEQLIAKI